VRLSLPPLSLPVWTMKSTTTTRRKRRQKRRRQRSHRGESIGWADLPFLHFLSPITFPTTLLSFANSPSPHTCRRSLSLSCQSALSTVSSRLRMSDFSSSPQLSLAQLPSTSSTANQRLDRLTSALDPTIGGEIRLRIQFEPLLVRPRFSSLLLPLSRSQRRRDERWELH
jgi:hypothetical protein